VVGALVGEGVGVGRAVGSGTVRNCVGAPNLVATVPAFSNLVIIAGARLIMFSFIFEINPPLFQFVVNFEVKLFVAEVVLLYEKSSNVNFTVMMNCTVESTENPSFSAKRRVVPLLTMRNEPRSALLSLSVMADRVVSIIAVCTPVEPVRSEALIEDIVCMIS
jgi:hypothetical protein